MNTLRIVLDLLAVLAVAVLAFYLADTATPQDTRRDTADTLERW